MSKDIHQQLMNEAYESDCNSPTFLQDLDDVHRYAVVLGNMNYQVENGGWEQWVYNGYCTAYPILMEALEIMDTENAKKIIKMVERVGEDLYDEVLEGTEEDKGCGGDYIDKNKHSCYDCDGIGTVYTEDYDDDGELIEEEEICSQCDGQGYFIEDHPYEEECTEYYKINEEFMKEAEVFLQGLYENQIPNSKG